MTEDILTKAIRINQLDFILPEDNEFVEDILKFQSEVFGLKRHIIPEHLDPIVFPLVLHLASVHPTLNTIDKAGEIFVEKWVKDFQSIEDVFLQRLSEAIDSYQNYQSSQCEDSYYDIADLAGAFICLVSDRFAAQFKCLEEWRQKSELEILAKSQVKYSPKKQAEKQLEDSLYLWLISHGVQAERQIATRSKHRLDIWIPGFCFLELKAGQVNADDLCQALDYYATYRKTVVLIGKNLSPGASRGLSAASSLVGDDAIVFVSWGASKDYLSRILGLK